MDELNRLRRQQQILGARPFGFPAQIERLWAAQVEALPHAAALSRLPVAINANIDAGSMQDGDGNPFFMFGLSTFITGADASSQDPFG